MRTNKHQNKFDHQFPSITIFWTCFLYEAVFFAEGTRMWRRGADPKGYAANFVESEQIMQSNGFTASYVQVHLFTQCKIIIC